MSGNRVVILTLSFGSGHVRAAEVVQRALLDGGEDVEVRTIDALELARSWFLTLYVRPYWWMLANAPWMWRWLFERREKKFYRVTAPHRLFPRGCAEGLPQIKEVAPRPVIATEVGAAGNAALGGRGGGVKPPHPAVPAGLLIEAPLG